MKKSKEKVEKEQQDLEGADLFSKNLSKNMKSGGLEFITEHSMVPIEQLLNGRMSFKGMNPEVERLMEQEMREIMEKKFAKERTESNQPEISDLEMANCLRKTVARKFSDKTSKRNEENTSNSSDEEEDGSVSSPPKRGKFLKPSDD